MLQNFRDRMGKYGKWLMVLIAIPFALFGVQSFFFRARSVDEAASVDGERITQLEVRQAVQRQRAQILARFRDVDPSLIEDKVLQAPALQNLITTQIYANRARAEGMGVAPALIAQVLKDAPAFQQDGKFSKNQYLAYIAQQGYTPQTHSRFLARELLATELARGIASTGFVTKPALERTLSEVEQTRDFRYLVVPPPAAPAAVDEAAERAYYDSHPDLYVAPEHVTVNYIELSLDAMAAAVAVDDAELRERYQRRVDAAEAAKQRIVAQILVKPRADGSHRKLLDELQAALAKGADFAQLARTRSEDPLTADQGGELGPYEPARFPPPIRSVLDKLQPGGVTAPIESDLGWYLFKMVREDKPAVGSFAAERDALVAELRKEKAGTLYQDQMEHLRETAYAAENIGTVASSLGLPLKTSGPITRDGGEGIGGNPKVAGAAFAEEVLKGGYISPVVELDDAHAVVVQLKEHIPQQRQAFADVKEQVAKALAAERGLAAARERAEDYRKRLLAGEPLEKIAQREHLEWQAVTGVRRYDKDAATEVARRAFAVAKGSSLPVNGVFDDAKGIVVFEVTAVHDGDVAAVPPPRRQQLATAALEAVAGGELSAYQSALLAGARIDTRAPEKTESR